MYKKTQKKKNVYNHSCEVWGNKNQVEVGNFYGGAGIKKIAKHGVQSEWKI